MLRTGVDIIEVGRVADVLSRHGPRFLDRCFTPAEQARCAGLNTSIAARFAAKEAVAKALGTGIGDVRWIDIEVMADERGKPELVLHGMAAEKAAELGLREWSISLSHTKDYAVAFVVALG